MTIISNQVLCKKCGDKPFSAHRHDFRYCQCGSIAVDGGMDYLKRVGDFSKESIEDISIVMPEAHATACIEAVKWAHETGRNDRGVAYAVIRALRDSGYDMHSFRDDRRPPVEVARESDKVVKFNELLIDYLFGASTLIANLEWLEEVTGEACADEPEDIIMVEKAKKDYAKWKQYQASQYEQSTLSAPAQPDPAAYRDEAGNF